MSPDRPTACLDDPKEAASLARSMVRANGVDLFVRDTATGLPPMLCLHGMEGRGETFTGLIARYRDRCRAIAPDQRGHGMSGRPVARCAGEDLAEDAHQLLLQLRAMPAVVVAHSMGASVAPFLAARHPEAVKGLVLLVRAAGSRVCTRESAEQVRSLVRDCTCVEIADAGHMLYLEKPEETFQALDQWLKRV